MLLLSKNQPGAYRSRVKARGQELSVDEREKLIQPYLPEAESPREKQTSQWKHAKRDRKPRQKPIRTFLKSKFYLLVYLALHWVFGVYLQLRHLYDVVVDRIFMIVYYRHRTPGLIEKDVKHLRFLPEHLSVILTLQPREDGGLDALAEDIAELGAWCTSAGIPILSVYEKTGILKPDLVSLHALLSQRLRSYFGSSSDKPRLRVHAPNYASYPSSTSSPHSSSIPQSDYYSTSRLASSSAPSLDILLLSSVDGRDTLVDLTRTLAEKTQSQKLEPGDITQNLVDDIISATTSIPPSPPPTPPLPLSSQKLSETSASSISNKQQQEQQQQQPPSSMTTPTSLSDPDLLLIFGPYVRLDGYPPWQLRLTEIHCVGSSSAYNSSGGHSLQVDRLRHIRRRDRSEGKWKAGRRSAIGSSISSASTNYAKADSGEDNDGYHHQSGSVRPQYHHFLRALWKYAGTEARFGR